MKTLVTATIATTLFFSTNAFATPEAPEKVSQCIACHGAGGNSVVPTFPKLAGQHAGYIAKQLKDFRDGFRKDPTMSAFAKPLTDDEIKALSEYYAAQ